MHLFKTFLFYYGLVVSTTLFIASYFLLPKPQNVASCLALLPIVIYFWNGAANPNALPLPKWSSRFILIVILLSLLSVYAYFLSVKMLPGTKITGTTLDDIKTSLNESNTSEQEYRKHLEEEITILKTKLDSIGRDPGVMGVSETPTPTPPSSIGRITAKDANLTSIPVYESASASSKVMTTVEYGIVYPFSEKATDWFKISQGWVEAKWFTEISP